MSAADLMLPEKTITGSGEADNSRNARTKPTPSSSSVKSTSTRLSGTAVFPTARRAAAPVSAMTNS
jgi:hypothetical protein